MSRHRRALVRAGIAPPRSIAALADQTTAVCPEMADELAPPHMGSNSSSVTPPRRPLLPADSAHAQAAPEPSPGLLLTVDAWDFLDPADPPTRVLLHDRRIAILHDGNLLHDLSVGEVNSPMKGTAKDLSTCVVSRSVIIDLRPQGFSFSKHFCHLVELKAFSSG